MATKVKSLAGHDVEYLVIQARPSGAPGQVHIQILTKLTYNPNIPGQYSRDYGYAMDIEHGDLLTLVKTLLDNS